MIRIILLVFIVAYLIWWGFQNNRDLPQRAGNSRWFKRFRRQNSGRQVQEWATLSSLHEEHDLLQGLPDEKQQAFDQWLKNLDEDQVRTLTKQIEKFCKASQLDLRGLMNGSAQKDPILAQGIGASVVAYLLAYWEAHEVQDRAAAFAIYERWQSKPAGRRNRPLTQALFDKLSEQGSVPVLPSNLALASQRERLAYIVAAIQNAAERDIGVVYSAIEDIEREKAQTATGSRVRATQLRDRFRRQPAPAAAVEATT
jgi:hypothetical protein